MLPGQCQVNKSRSAIENGKKDGRHSPTENAGASQLCGEPESQKSGYQGASLPGIKQICVVHASDSKPRRFCLPLRIFIPLLLLPQSTHFVDTLYSLLVPDSTVPRQRLSASHAPTTISMLHYEQTPVMPSDHIAPPTKMPIPNSTSANSTIAATTTPVPQHRHIWIITGPAGCGKTSVAEYLAATFAMPYLEGDSVSLLRYL